MLFEPFVSDDVTPHFELIDASTNTPYSESEYFEYLRQIYNSRNPHGLIGEDDLDFEE